jgi:GGDEF domain-containing protein
VNEDLPPRTWTPLLPAAALFVFLVLALASAPGVPAWAGDPLFSALPYALLGVAAVLGLFFTQSRIAYLCLALAALTLRVNASLGPAPRPESAAAAVFLASLGIPCLTGWLYHLRERGVFNVNVTARTAVVLAVAFVILTLPAISDFCGAVASAHAALLRPMSSRLRIPAAGFLACLVAIPALLIRRRHESPVLGPLLGVALLFVLMALNFDSVMWRPGRGQAVFLAFMSGAAAILAWAVLESAWRHAHIDELTGLPGRRALKHHFACLGPDYQVAVLDLDHFKKVNDTYGHDVGDQVLRFVAARLAANTAGRAYRYGGEEFVIVSEGAALDKTLAALEQLRRAIAETAFHLRGKGRPLRKPKRGRPAGRGRDAGAIPVTVSIGVAASDQRYASPPQVMEAADKALYRAKEEGRNRVCKAGRGKA